MGFHVGKEKIPERHRHNYGFIPPCTYGVYVFVSREIGDYMLLKTHFLFLDFDETLIHFLLDYFTIMVLFAAIGYYLQKLFIYKSQRKKKI